MVIRQKSHLNQSINFIKYPKKTYLRQKLLMVLLLLQLIAVLWETDILGLKILSSCFEN